MASLRYIGAIYIYIYIYICIGSRVFRGYVGILEKKRETTIVYWGYVGILEKTMETTIVS